MKFGEVVDSLMAGKPITREIFREEGQTREPYIRYIRYSELLDKFEIVHFEKLFESKHLHLSGDNLYATDWIIGKFDPRTGECRYENDK